MGTKITPPYCRMADDRTAKGVVIFPLQELSGADGLHTSQSHLGGAEDPKKTLEQVVIGWLGGWGGGSCFVSIMILVGWVVGWLFFFVVVIIYPC